MYTRCYINICIFNSNDFGVHFKAILLFLVLLNALIMTELSVCTGNSALVYLVNPQHACAKVIVVTLFVCLSVADLEDGGLLALQRDMNLKSTMM